VSTQSEFAKDLCDYLSEYRLSDITYWIDRIKNCDLSGISDRLVFSVPGYHQASRMNKFGHSSLSRLLQDRPPKQDSRRCEAHMVPGINIKAAAVAEGDHVQMEKRSKGSE
ncbi:hypothetical protein ANCDUO_17448, partial [Ancylostoma duodenale]